MIMPLLIMYAAIGAEFVLIGAADGFVADEDAPMSLVIIAILIALILWPFVLYKLYEDHH